MSELLPVCCYCDAVLSCSACGREQPTVAPRGQVPDELSELGDELNAMFDQYLNSPVASVRDRAAVRLRSALWDNKAGIIARLRAPGDPSSTAMTVEPVALPAYKRCLEAAARDIKSIHEKMGERGLLNLTAAVQHLCHSALDQIEVVVRDIATTPSDAARVDIYEAALKRISASRMNDFGTLHPEGCAAEAKEALHRASLVPAPIEAGWQDISTAPKDGTEIMVAGPMFNDLANGRYVSDAIYFDGAWRTDEESSPLYTPTHWQPIPEPPPISRNDETSGGARS